MSNRNRLEAHVEALAGASVLCVGDAMLDRFVYGGVDRVSPEAPIPVLRIERETTMPGGAANVVRNLVSLEASCHFVSVVGEDAAGGQLKTLLDNMKGVCAHLERVPARRTTVKTRFIAGGQQLIRADYESTETIPDRVARALVETVTTCLQDTDVLVLSDYGKGVLSRDVIGRLISLAHDSDTPVLVDPKGADYRRYQGATLISPNEHELAMATGLPAATDEEVIRAAKRLTPDISESVAVTRGARGITLVAEHEAHVLSGEQREVFDVSGAGDTVIAVLAVALSARVPLLEAATLANLAGGIAVSKVGTAAVRVDELRSTLQDRERLKGDSKVSSLAQCLESVERWRKNGLRIGFTNGCFDLLHPGHVSLLAQARAACDRLVVGLNNDASTTRLKGPDRPIQPAAARSAVLASLASVDLVVLFGDDTPLKLIEAIRPDVLVKGADWTPDRIAGADLVQSYGGRVLLADLSEGYSTTSTISRLNR